MVLTNRDCPRHHVRLTEETIELPWARDIHIDRCPDCAGVFLDKGEVKRITGHDHLNDLLTKHLGVDSDSTLVCPACGMVMDAEDADGVEVDVCLSCFGVWLDGGELAALKEREDEVFHPDNFDPVKMAEISRAKEVEGAGRKRAFEGFLYRLTGRDLMRR